MYSTKFKTVLVACDRMMQSDKTFKGYYRTGSALKPIFYNTETILQIKIKLNIFVNRKYALLVIIIHVLLRLVHVYIYIYIDLAVGSKFITLLSSFLT